ncbi:hypothetical protein QSH57_013180 [Fusarium oxysporum f. sp. vasinfectum]|nr:hypothetical protein QSH57_013180 [Fusarium oxysporum f. sp. vasinfectum]
MSILSHSEQTLKRRQGWDGYTDLTQYSIKYDPWSGRPSEV